MGLRERQHEKIDRRAADFLRDKLHHGEEIRGVTFGQVRPRGWLALEELFGVFAYFAIRYYYLEIVWAEPHSSLAVDRFKRGRLWMLLYLRRVGDGQTIRFRAQRTAWGATDRVTEVARVLREARGGLPG